MNLTFRLKNGQTRIVLVKDQLPFIELPAYHFATPKTIDLYDDSFSNIDVKSLLFERVEVKSPHFNMSWIEYHEV